MIHFRTLGSMVAVVGLTGCGFLSVDTSCHARHTCPVDDAGDDAASSPEPSGDSGPASTSDGTINMDAAFDAEATVTDSAAVNTGDADAEAGCGSTCAPPDAGVAIAQGDGGASDGAGSDGSARCNVPADCPNGTTCNTTIHQCTTSCAGGLVCQGSCCDGTSCQSGTSNVACGPSGGTCINCSGTACNAMTFACRTWTRVTDPTTDDLNGIWGSGPSDVWAAADGSSGARILHWNGMVWSTSATVPSVASFTAVWGTGPNNAWAVGSTGATLQWDGSTWSRVTNPVDGDNALLGLWGAGANDVWAVGTTIMNWDGGWRIATSGLAAGFNDVLGGVWGSASNDVWAVGTGVAYHFDGNTWSPVAIVPASANHLNGIWGSAPNDIWAVGDNSTIVHWNGQAWSGGTTGHQGSYLAVWGSGSTDVWAVGQVSAHWDGSGWTPVTSLSGPVLDGVWGSGPTDAWAVGPNGTILHYQ